MEEVCPVGTYVIVETACKNNATATRRQISVGATTPKVVCDLDD